MKTCLQCPKRLRSDYKLDVCQKCRSVCHCGTKKDWRAEQCRSCASKDGAKLQWQKMRPKMLAQLTKAGVRRRQKFSDLTYESFHEIKHDGRRYAHYWDEAGRYRTFYRYRWVWMQHHGVIPEGCHIHHIDHDPANDDISNLVMLTGREHHQLHGAEMHEAGAKWECRHCLQPFYRTPRGETRIRKYCSKTCHYDHIRGMPRRERQNVLPKPL